MDNGFINWYLERYRFFDSNNHMLDNLKRYFLDSGDMNSLMYRVRYRFFDRNRHFFYNRNDYSFRYRNLNRYGVWYRDQYRLVNFELYVLRYGYDDFFVVLDWFWAFFVNVLMDGVRVGLKVMSTEAMAGIATISMAGNARIEATSGPVAAKIKPT